MQTVRPFVNVDESIYHDEDTSVALASASSPMGEDDVKSSIEEPSVYELVEVTGRITLDPRDSNDALRHINFSCDRIADRAALHFALHRTSIGHERIPETQETKLLRSVLVRWCLSQVSTDFSAGDIDSFFMSEGVSQIKVKGVPQASALAPIYRELKAQKEDISEIWRELKVHSDDIAEIRNDIKEMKEDIRILKEQVVELVIMFKKFSPMLTVGDTK